MSSSVFMTLVVVHTTALRLYFLSCDMSGTPPGDDLCDSVATRALIMKDSNVRQSIVRTSSQHANHRWRWQPYDLGQRVQIR